MPRGPICPQHNCHPDKCFEIHYPESTRGVPVDYEAIHDAMLRERLEEQNERIRREREKMDEGVVDARRHFQEARDRHQKGA